MMDRLSNQAAIPMGIIKQNNKDASKIGPFSNEMISKQSEFDFNIKLIQNIVS